MAFGKPEHPEVLIRALQRSGYRRFDRPNGWVALEHPARPHLPIVIKVVQPLSPEKMEQYLRAAELSESEYERLLKEVLRDPTD